MSQAQYLDTRVPYATSSTAPSESLIVAGAYINRCRAYRCYISRRTYTDVGRRRKPTPRYREKCVPDLWLRRPWVCETGVVRLPSDGDHADDPIAEHSYKARVSSGDIAS